jgi:hypothetical protein
MGGAEAERVESEPEACASDLEGRGSGFAEEKAEKASSGEGRGVAEGGPEGPGVELGFYGGPDGARGKVEDVERGGRIYPRVFDDPGGEMPGVAGGVGDAGVVVSGAWGSRAYSIG